MMDTVDEYLKIYSKEGHNSLKQVTDFLAGWLINHIQESDQNTEITQKNKEQRK
jgi:hemerythrin